MEAFLDRSFAYQQAHPVFLLFRPLIDVGTYTYTILGPGTSPVLFHVNRHRSVLGPRNPSPGDYEDRIDALQRLEY